jgi:hypothetical protein
MTGVMATLEANHSVGIMAQKVNNFSFSLVPPLRAENYDALIHLYSIQKLQQKSAGKHADDAADADGSRIKS